MTPSVIRFADLVPSPWKNGGGVTREIARRDLASGEGFLWRLSAATVASDGPFSAFPGIDRTILCLTGEGMMLDFAARGAMPVTLRDAPLSFAGEDQVSARLLVGDTLDLNIMTLRSQLSHQVTRVALSQSVRFATMASETLLMATGPVRLITDKATHDLAAFDSVIGIGKGSQVELAPIDGTVDLIRIELEPVETAA